MVLKINNNNNNNNNKCWATSSSSTSSSSSSCVRISFILLSALSFAFFFHLIFISSSNKPFITRAYSQKNLQTTAIPNSNSNSIIKVYVADLPRSYNYDLLNQYWASTSADSRLPSDPDHRHHPHPHPTKYPPYPENPLIKQYSAEYWILGDLETPEIMRSNSFAKRVFDPDQADVVFVPFFATLSAEMELAKHNNSFRKKSAESNDDYRRQKQVIDIITNSLPWKRSGGRDHVFVLTAYD